MTRRLLSLLTSFGLMLSLGACGDDDAAFDSGLDPTTMASGLSSVQEADLCFDANDYFQSRVSTSDRLRAACTMSALDDATDPSDCVTRRDACLSELTEVPSGFDFKMECADRDGDMGDVVGCQATVAQLEQCLTETGDSFANLLSAISCDMAGDPNAEFPEMTEPEVCQTITAMCPNL